MNKQIGNILVLVSILLFNSSFSQETIKNDTLETTNDVFSEADILPIKMSYSNKEIKKDSNDSTYIDSNLSYQLKDGYWQDLPVQLRRRGNNRLKNCYFVPLKVKLKKSDTKNTSFEGHKNLKIVLPCLLEKDNNDNVVKEYLVYKLFEVVSPYSFMTRLLDINFEEEKGNKTKTFQLKGILVEDDKKMAKRLDGKVYDRNVHPLNQEPVSSIRNALFEYMIGNTDFSQAYQHNIKLLYIDSNMVPIPYDFDMSGFVNTSYAVVSEINGESLGLNSVTDRKYRGFVRDVALFEKVRQEFIGNRDKFISILNDHASFFDRPEEFRVAKAYILEFLDIIIDDQQFRDKILRQARTK